MSEEEKESSTPPNMEVQNIDQIREIILGPQMRNIGDLMFGSQIRELEKRFAKLEQALVDESNTLRSETSSRLEALEHYVKREVGSLSELIAVERREREEDVQQFQYELSKYANDTEKKVKQAESNLDQSKAETRNAMLDQSKSLLSELQSVRVSITENINKNVDALQSEKTDRHVLGDIFNEFSMRLHGELKQRNEK